MQEHMACAFREPEAIIICICAIFISMARMEKK